MKPGPLTCAVMTMLTLTAPRAAAHAVGLECKLQGDVVRVEAYFDDDTPARAARLTVVDEAGKSIATGISDETGTWKFPRPAPGRYSVTVDAGPGHRATVKVTVPAATSAGPEQNKIEPATNSATSISDGPTRTEFTRVPWLQIVIGLGLLGVLGIGASWWRRARRHVHAEVDS